MERNSPEYKVRSKELLKKNMTTKIKTTMIGSISIIEDRLTKLWGNLESDLEREIFEAFQSARSEILKKGHKQMENACVEIDTFEVNWLRYQTKIPIMKINP